MYSIAFPNMISSSTVRLLEDRKAIKQSIELILRTERKSLFGDPFYGTALKQAFFEQSNSVIVDLVIDEIYTTLITFIPQIYLKRSDISITTDGTDLFATANFIYIKDNTSDMFSIKLTQSDGI